jgi:nitroreductase
MFLELMRKRRSVRRFEARPVEPEKVDLLVEAALRSPSSRGLNPWEIVVVADRGMLEKLAACKEHGAAFLADAPLGILVAADSARSDAWVEDASIAALMVQLAAEALGLGSCWIQIRNRMRAGGAPAQDYVAGLLGLPAGVMAEAILAVGYPAEEKRERPRSALRWGQIHAERYGAPYPRR